MKKILSLVVLFASVFVAQTHKSILELKNDIVAVNLSSTNLTNSNNQSEPITFISEQMQRKSPGIAILYSLLLPGMGELYAGNYDSGRYFTIADGVLWGTMLGVNMYGNWKQNNYETFAIANAGASFSGKDSDFRANVGKYLSVDDYNNEMDLTGYPEKVYKSQAYYWRWQSNDQRKEYRDLWSSSESAFNSIRFIAGALILNRVISVVNAVRLVSAYNKNLNQQVSWNVYFGVQDKPTLPHTLTFNFVKSF